MYSSNRNSQYPFNLIFTSINGRTKERLDGFSDAAHTRWKGTEWWEEGYERLWANTTDVEEIKAIKRQVVYLTADTDADLLELRPDETYIIGGIVDHNRYKVHFTLFDLFCHAIIPPRISAWIRRTRLVYARDACLSAATLQIYQRARS